MGQIIPIKKCRSCNSSNLIPIHSLGEQYFSNFIESNEDPRLVKCPLSLVLCKDCSLLQLEHSVPPEVMYSDTYWYQSGISKTIREDLKNIVEKAKKLIHLNQGDIVLDIACNDGTLLRNYSENIIKVGFDPATNLIPKAKEGTNKIINNYFNAPEFKKEFENKKAKIVTIISMFYDLEDPNKFLEDIKQVMDEKGVLIIQQNYLASMLKQNAFDNICHEHLEYYSLLSFENLINKHGLKVFDVELSNINGGSIRTYIKFKENLDLNGFENSEQRINEIRKNEVKMELNTEKPYKEFASRIDSIKENVLNFLDKAKKENKKVCFYGASTRGNVALQYFDIKQDDAICIADKNPDKHNKKTVGTLIPIVSPEEFRKINPDYLFVMTWHFFDEIKEQEKEYFEKGGKLVKAMPEFSIVSKKD